MPSTFFGLTIGYSGLLNYQAALNTTGHNISNVKTQGYTRQEVTQTAAKALRTHMRYGMAGAGVETVSIEQIRNVYYDIKYWNNNADLGQHTMKSYYMKQIENYFADYDDKDRKVMGFNSIYIKKFCTEAMESLEDNPGDVTVRNSFVGTARSLTEYFNETASNLERLQRDTNEEIKDKVDEINSIATQITALNQQINMVEVRGTMANDLRDKRNLLIDQLSKIVTVEISEIPVYNANDPDNPTGMNRYIVSIDGGHTLVDGYERKELYCISRDVGNKVNQSDAEGLYDIYWKHTGMKFEPTGNVSSGELKGLFEMRDGNNNEYFHGKITGCPTVKEDILDANGNKVGERDAVKELEITVSNDDEYLTDLSKTKLNETGSITVNGLTYKYEGWTYEAKKVFEADGTTPVIDPDTGEQLMEYVYTFRLAPDELQEVPTVQLANRAGQNAKIGSAVDYQGIPYYMSQMNEWVRNFAKAFNDVEAKGVDLYNEKLADGYDPDTGVYDSFRAFFVAKDPTDPDNEYNFLRGHATTVSTSDDSYYKMTAFTFSVNTGIVNDPRKMSTTTKYGDINVDANDIIQELEQIRTNKDMMVFRGCSSSEFLQCILGDVALNASSAYSFTETYEDVEAAISTQRMSISGVDEDEEGINLVKFQHAYDLSAKLIQVMTEVYDRLILQTGV